MDWRKLVSACALIVCMTAALMTGCSQKTGVESELTSKDQSDEDIAISIAALVAEENGGSLDLVGDALELATAGQPGSLAKQADASVLDTREAVWDSVSQSWAIHVERERGSADGEFYAHFERDRTVQFLDAEGEPRKRWFWEGDTARSILVSIREGSGRVIRPRLSHTLKSISGEFEVTGTHTDTVTLNGMLTRSAVDTVITLRGTRISDHSVTLNFTDVVGPRGSRRDLTQKVSGVISGTYSAEVTIETETGVVTKEVNQNFSVELGVDELLIHIGGSRFRAHAGSGELIEEE